MTQQSGPGIQEARESTSSRAEVQDLLDRMARALTAGDGRAIAGMWETPAFVLGDGMAMTVSSEAELERFFGGAKEQYNAKGISDTRAEIVKLEWPTRRIAVVQVHWPYLDAKGATHGSETSTYTLRRDDSGKLRLRIALLHGAAA